MKFIFLHGPKICTYIIHYTDIWSIKGLKIMMGIKYYGLLSWEPVTLPLVKVGEEGHFLGCRM